MLNMKKHNIIFFLISAVVIYLDTQTKRWASETLKDGVVIEVFSFLEFHLAHNYGAAFSMLSEAGGWQRWFFLVFSLVVSVVLIFWILKLSKQEKFLAVALALILGGGIGNLIDRAMLGYVVDFISVFYNEHVFPTFNVADSAISVGAVMIFYDMLFLEKKR
ncbi:MAG: signal peptidase II, partial [Pseudomonadota bacterium]